jgi:hypothetical protein
VDAVDYSETLVHIQRYIGGDQGHLVQAPSSRHWGWSNIIFLNLKYCDKEAREWEFNFIQLLASYSYPLVDIRLIENLVF